MRLDAIPWLKQGPLAELLAVLDRDGEEARVVGGSVRNALLGEPIGDIDVATTAPPDEVTRRAQAAGFRAVPTGIEHGTVTVVIAGRPFEVTTLREDVETFGRKARVVFGRDWRKDAERRDFTMNALSATRDGTVHDYVGGLDDLKARRVRFIGDPHARIAEDYLRILRFFRFHAAYGEGAPDPAGLAACIAGRAGLETLSRERVRTELLKLMPAPHAVATLGVMAEAGLIVAVLGGVPLLASFARMAQCERAAALAPDAVRHLGALAVQIEEDAVRLGARLRLSNAEQNRLAVMAAHWRAVSPDADRAMRALLYRLGPDAFADAVLLAWSRAPQGTSAARWLALVALPQHWIIPVFPLRAADFIVRGVEKGPALGAALAAAERAWIAADFPSDAPALEALAAAAVAEAPRK